MNDYLKGWLNLEYRYKTVGVNHCWRMSRVKFVAQFRVVLVEGFGVEVGVDGSLSSEGLVGSEGVVFVAEVVDVLGEIDDGCDVVAV